MLHISLTSEQRFIRSYLLCWNNQVSRNLYLGVQLHRDTYGSKIKRALEQNSSHYQPNPHSNLAFLSKSSLSLKSVVTLLE